VRSWIVRNSTIIRRESRRQLEHGLLAHALALQRAADRRTHRHVPVLQLAGIAKHSSYVSRDLDCSSSTTTASRGRPCRPQSGDIDVGQLGDALRELAKPCLHELLALQGRLVFAVFLQVAEFDGLPDFLWKDDVELV
jgi:hypothetical protein